MKSRRRRDAVEFGRHDSAIWYTKQITDAIRQQRWTDLPLLTTYFPPQLHHGERMLVHGEFSLMTFRAVGNGTYSHQSGFVFATGVAGLAASAVFAGAQAIGNASRRNAAYAATMPRWVVDDQGQLIVSTHGFYLDTGRALLSWGWDAIDALQLVAPGTMHLRGMSTDGPVNWLIASDWAELSFALWAMVRHPSHPHLAGDAWIPPGWHERDAQRVGRKQLPSSG